MKPLTIVTIGGNVIDNPTKINKFLKDFRQIKTPRILIHGGGKSATEFYKRLGITPQMHQGRRITNAETLEVATMIYGGLINKKIVATEYPKNREKVVR